MRSVCGLGPTNDPDPALTGLRDARPDTRTALSHAASRPSRAPALDSARTSQRHQLNSSDRAASQMATTAGWRTRRSPEMA